VGLGAVLGPAVLSIPVTPTSRASARFATREADALTLKVSDTRIGMIREALASVFDLLTQVEARADRTRGGLGIGLALVRQIVELQGGGVIAGSTRLGQGM